MTEALYERYKDALRRGHVAVQRGRLDEALDAYGDAARVAPDRALPLVGIAQVLLRLGKPADAISTFDRALERAPTDEVALRGRVDALLALGDRVRAADTLDAMAEVAKEAGRHGDAVDLVAQALELAEGRDRRATLSALVADLQADSDKEAAAGPLARAGALLAGPIGPEPPPPPRPFDPAAAMAAVEDAAATGNREVTREAALDAARGFREGGQLHAAIDACYQALATNPSDAAVHLTLAELYIDRGWRAVAADKLVLLTSLIDVEGDRATHDRLCALAARIPDDPRLETICA